MGPWLPLWGAGSILMGGGVGEVPPPYDRRSWGLLRRFLWLRFFFRPLVLGLTSGSDEPDFFLEYFEIFDCVEIDAESKCVLHRVEVSRDLEVERGWFSCG